MKVEGNWHPAYNQHPIHILVLTPSCRLQALVGKTLAKREK